MNTEDYGPNMNITIQNDKTKKLVTIEIDHTIDILQNISKGTGLLNAFEDILETKLMPIHVYEKGFFVSLSEDKLITLIEALTYNIPKDENGQLVVKKSHLLWTINKLKTLL